MATMQPYIPIMRTKNKMLDLQIIIWYYHHW